ncbi:nanos homolog 1-like [Ciona intestinalis]
MQYPRQPVPIRRQVPIRSQVSIRPQFPSNQQKRHLHNNESNFQHGLGSAMRLPPSDRRPPALSASHHLYRPSMPPVRHTRPRVQCCAFCKSNREPMDFYSTHLIRDSTGRITCPVLRRHVCRFCGATGDFAHTASYCIHNPERGSSMKTVLSTPTMSSGRKRNARR